MCGLAHWGCGSGSGPSCILRAENFPLYNMVEKKEMMGTALPEFLFPFT